MIDASARTCPICGKPADAGLKPFCSARCADVDLNRWFAGAYVVPGREEDDTDEPLEPRDQPRRGDS
jgi:endogenous inhibitor of DNA gyrase (YacG/DUF329 family)